MDIICLLNIELLVFGSIWTASNYIGIIVFGFLFLVAIILYITEKIDHHKYNEVYKNEKDKLTNQARLLLYERENIMGKSKYKYLHYARKKEWLDWFIKGYQDGARKYIIGSFPRKEQYTWEQVAEEYINIIREELVGGDRNMALNAYKDGYREGLKKFNTKSSN